MQMCGFSHSCSRNKFFSGNEMYLTCKRALIISHDGFKKRSLEPQDLLAVPEEYARNHYKIDSCFEPLESRDASFSFDWFPDRAHPSSFVYGCLIQH
jgi:hypothetical protein